MNGVLVIDKPSGITSFDVIRLLRPALHEKRMGHTGTLDPMATGVLAVCIGEATRIVPFLIEHDKEYEAELTLGEERDTQDATGEVVSKKSVAGIDEAAVRQTSARLIGPISQVPPMYSAVKVGGERLYSKARRGEVVDRAPRRVIVHSLQVLAFDSPRLRIRVHCSKGTYVRTLASDLGDMLGCGAHLSALRRLRSGPFTLDRAHGLDDVLRRAKVDGLAEELVAASDALIALPLVVIDSTRERKARHGQPLTEEDLTGLGTLAPAKGTMVRLASADGRLVAVGESTGNGIRYARVLAQG
jgi:tRNA pseudouridine55 synthase